MGPPEAPQPTPVDPAWTRCGKRPTPLCTGWGQDGDKVPNPARFGRISRLGAHPPVWTREVSGRVHRPDSRPDMRPDLLPDTQPDTRPDTRRVSPPVIRLASDMKGQVRRLPGRRTRHTCPSIQPNPAYLPFDSVRSGLSALAPPASRTQGTSAYAVCGAEATAGIRSPDVPQHPPPPQLRAARHA